MDKNYLEFANFFDNKKLKAWIYYLYQEMQKGSICVDVSDKLYALFDNDDKLIYVESLKDDNSKEEILKSITKVLGYNINIDNLIQVFNYSDVKNFVSDDLSDTNKPFVLYNNKLYFQRYFNYETNILEFINIKKIVSEEPSSNHPKKYESWQEVAEDLCINNNFSIITGGPGTGKTTVVGKILNRLIKENKDLKFIFAAPTGKAAARLKESINNSKHIKNDVKEKVQALTIHKLLGYQRDSIYFKHNKENKLQFDVIIIDESSMIDISLMSKLFDAIAEDTKIILLGDKNQLSSVEAGSLFGDLCNGNERAFVGSDYNLKDKYAVELKVSHRFPDTSSIGQFSKAILENNIDDLTKFVSSTTTKTEVGGRIHTVDIKDNDKDNVHLNDFCKGYQSYIKIINTILPKDYIVDGSNILDESKIDEIIKDLNLTESEEVKDFKKQLASIDINKEKELRKFIEDKKIKAILQEFNKNRVLCAVREDKKYGLNDINIKIEELLGLKSKDIFYHNKPIMVTKNQPELGLNNGDVGIVLENNNELMAYFDVSGEIIKVNPNYIINPETAFAMTIHKSQGSEFDNIFIIIPENKENISFITKELLYTAVTRAKSKVVLVASEDLIKNVCSKTIKRMSGLQGRLNN